MTTKEKVLKTLISKKGEPISGSAIAESLGVTRTAIWKAIKILEDEGYDIEAVSGKGYTLSYDNDIVSDLGIMKYLPLDDGDAMTFDEVRLSPKIIVLDVVDSTNDYIRLNYLGGNEEGICVVATTQSGGKGRRGRSFFSPKDSGVYFSILLKPLSSGKDATHITAMAAVAVAKAMEKCDAKDVTIKWVNDIYVNNKKVCGILTEAVTDLESGAISDVILGIGINIYMPEGGFPEEIRERAGALFDEKKEDVRNKIVAYTVSEFFKLYFTDDFTLTLEEYKKRCFVLGKDIKVISNGGEVRARAEDIDEECHLVVRYLEGKRKGMREILLAGEINIDI